MSLYLKRGVSAQKEEVHKATARLDPGLYPHAFCRLYPDYLGGDSEWLNVMHADGAGTKSILAYLQWKETGDPAVWKGIAQDAVVMNLDDLLCTGIHDNMLFSSTIDRNKKLIPGEVLETIINSTQELFDQLAGHGIGIHYLGGETADVGDVVRTIAVNGTLAARWPKKKVISNDKITAGDVIVGFAGFGRATYESFYNSGIGSNGLTSARHDVLGKSYGADFPESFDNSLDETVRYIGHHRLSDQVVADEAGAPATTIGGMLLSPTRTFAPVLKKIFTEHFDAIHGIIHCSGGGQTKCMKYLPGNFRVIKDNLFDPPPVFRLIQQSSGSDNREMYQVFNMGCRLEIFTAAKNADSLIAVARQFGIAARVTGFVEPAAEKELIIKAGGEEIRYA